MKQYTYYLIFFYIISFFFLGEPHAREQILRSSVSLDNISRSNIFMSSEEHVSEEKTIAELALEISSAGEFDSFRLKYSPSYIRNHRIDDYGITQNIVIAAEKQFSENFNFSVTDYFSHKDYSDNRFQDLSGQQLYLLYLFIISGPEIKAEVVRLLFVDYMWPDKDFDPEKKLHLTLAVLEIQARYDMALPETKAEVDLLLLPKKSPGRQRSYNNNFGFHSTFRFARDSDVGFGGSIASRRKNSDSNISEYDLFSSYLSLTRQLNESWNINYRYSFSKNNFETSADFNKMENLLSLKFKPDMENSITCDYLYSDSDYENSFQEQQYQSVNLSWLITYMENNSLTVSVSQFFKDNMADNEKGNQFDFGWRTTRQWANFFLTGKYEGKNKSDLWYGMARLEKDIWKDLSMNGSLGISNKSIRTLTEKINNNEFSGSIRLFYSFLGDYTAILDYSYLRSSTNSLAIDSYYEHQISIKCSYQKDLLHW
jgi:hypothetical protein